MSMNDWTKGTIQVLGTLAIAAAIAGCQTNMPREHAGSGTYISITETSEGWLQERSRICIRTPGQASVECEEGTEEMWVEGYRAATEAGLEVPAFASREQCERSKTLTMRHQGIRLSGRIDQIKCVRIEGAMTQGRGYFLSDIKLCKANGTCAGDGFQEMVGMFRAVARAAIEQGSHVPTFSSKAACEDTLSFVLLRWVESEEDLLDADGQKAEVRVRCARYR